MGSAQIAPPATARASKWWQYLAAGAAGALLFYLAAVVVPRVSLLWGYSGLKQLIYEDLGVPNESLASFLALVGSFIYAVAWGPMVLGTSKIILRGVNLRRAVAAFIPWILIYGHAPLLRALYSGDVCFNQRTGQPIKWYVIQTGGEIILRDGPGYDSSGEERRPVTAQICHIRQLQQRGIRPHQITGDPRRLNFFDPITGQPRVWYYKHADGQIDLFDGEGTHPTFGEPLVPVTTKIVEEAQVREVAKEAEAERKVREEASERERAARLATERSQAEAKEKDRDELIELFGVASYPDGAVIVGSKPRLRDEASIDAANQLLDTLLATARKKGLVADEFRPKVYAISQFDKMLNGDASVLWDIGLAQKMRAALVVSVDARCSPSSEVSGLMSCTINAHSNLIKANSNTSLRQWSETAPGATQILALQRAAELLIERHPEFLDQL